MLPKAKLAIMVLIVLLILSAFMGASLLSQKEALVKSEAKLREENKQYGEREKNLAQENKKLSDQLKEAQGTQARIQKQFSELNDKISALTTDRDDWKNKVEDLKKEQLKPNFFNFIDFMVIKPISWFLTTSIRNKGILDGYQGLVFSFFSAMRFPRAYWRYINK